MSENAVRARILEAATRLLTDGGPQAVSMRAVSAAAGVHGPAIYRFFADKTALVDAVSASAFERYLQDKLGLDAGDDPVDDFRRAWRLHVEFGLSNPDVYASIYGTPRRPEASAAMRDVEDQLALSVRAIAAAGRLALPEKRAIDLVHVLGRGTVLTIVGNGPVVDREELVADAERALLDQILTAPPQRGDRDATASRAATTLRAVLPDLPLTTGESGLLDELLARIETAGT